MLVFYKSDGEIAFTIEGDKIPPTLKHDNLAVLQVETIAPDIHMQYVENGEVLSKPDSPGDWAVWDTATKTWTDPRTSEEVTFAERQAVKARRDVAIESGVMVNGALMPTDAKSRELITGAAVSAMLDDTYTANWKMPGGTFVLLDATQIISMASVMRAHVQACFDREAEIITAIEAGTTYDLEAGWP